MPALTRRSFLRQSTLALATLSAGEAGDEVFDVLVYAGVPCGVACAVAAARMGARVLLLEPTGHVGGLNTSGLNTAETEHMLKWTFGGIALEFYQRLGRKLGEKGPAFYFLSGVAEAVFQEMLAEAGVTVRFGQRVEKVVREGARLRHVELSDGSRVAAKVFIDAGYEGDLMARAGVRYAVGREARTEFGESKAGIAFDPPRQAVTVDAQGALLPGLSGWARDFTEGDAHPGVMNYNWRLCFSRDPATQAPLPPPERAERSRFRLLENWLRQSTAAGREVKLSELLDLYQRRDGRVEVNNKQAAIISLGHFGGQFHYPEADYAARERIIADHTEYTRGLLHFLAHDEAVPEPLRREMQSYGLHTGEFADHGHWPYQLYVREARRMRGAVVMRQQEVTEERRKEDAIAMGSHFVDCHHVQRLAVSPEAFLNEGRIWLDGFAYQIPWRALTPRAAEATNLLVPGAASYTHVAFCTYRLESTWMMAGHAAGVAAALAARENAEVQALDVPVLQSYLRAQGQVLDFVPGQPEKFARAQPGGTGIPATK